MVSLPSNRTVTKIPAVPTMVTQEPKGIDKTLKIQIPSWVSTQVLTPVFPSPLPLFWL